MPSCEGVACSDLLMKWYTAGSTCSSARSTMEARFMSTCADPHTALRIEEDGAFNTTNQRLLISGTGGRDAMYMSWIPCAILFSSDPVLNKCFSRVRELEMVSGGCGKGFLAYKSTHKLSIWPAGTALREGNK